MRWTTSDPRITSSSCDSASRRRVELEHEPQPGRVEEAHAAQVEDDLREAGLPQPRDLGSAACRPSRCRARRPGRRARTRARARRRRGTARILPSAGLARREWSQCGSVNSDDAGRWQARSSAAAGWSPPSRPGFSAVRRPERAGPRSAESSEPLRRRARPTPWCRPAARRPTVGEPLDEEEAVAAAARAGRAHLDRAVAAGVVHLDAHGPVAQLRLHADPSPGVRCRAQRVGDQLGEQQPHVLERAVRDPLREAAGDLRARVVADGAARGG